MFQIGCWFFKTFEFEICFNRHEIEIYKHLRWLIAPDSVERLCIVYTIIHLRCIWFGCAVAVTMGKHDRVEISILAYFIKRFRVCIFIRIKIAMTKKNWGEPQAINKRMQQMTERSDFLGDDCSPKKSGRPHHTRLRGIVKNLFVQHAKGIPLSQKSTLGCK